MDTTANTSSRNNGSSTTMTPRSTAHREALSRVPCRYFNSPSGCNRGRDCWFLHDMAAPETSPNSLTDSSAIGPLSSSAASPPISAGTSNGSDTTCGICLEQPTKFGLMVNCSHVFCLYCIQTWRKREDKTEDTVRGGMHKTCPTCRKHSEYIVPSDVFYAHETPEKEAETKNSSPGTRYCPYGNSCHYAHNLNGARYTFSQRELAIFEARRQQRARQHNAEDLLYELTASNAVLGGLDESRVLVWNILHGLMDDEHELGGMYAPMGRHYDLYGYSEDDEDDEDYVDEEDEEDEDDEFEDYGSDDEIPDLIDNDIPDDLPDLVDDNSDDDAVPELIHDDEEEEERPPELLDDSDTMPELVDDSDALPDLIDDSDADDIPDLLSDKEDEDKPKTDPGPNSRYNSPSNRQTQSTSRVSVSNSSSPQTRSTPTVSNSTVQGSERKQTAPQAPPTTPSSALQSPTGFTPASRLRRFSPPQHTPPPGPRRPHPPHSRKPEPARSATTRTNVPTNVSDELGWEDEDGTTENSDAEISERERQRIRESEERGINARDWTSRARDLSYFSG